MGIEFNGLSELMASFEEMTITDRDARSALRQATKVVADEIEANTPKESGKMAKVKTSVRTNGDGFAEAKIRAGTHYSLFNEYGTSKMRQNMGYFAKSVSSSSPEAVEILKNELLNKVL